MTALRFLWTGPRWLLAGVVILFVKCYRVALRPLLPPLCRFEPSCSEYMILAVRKFGPFWGTAKGVRRICRCHPWNEGGYDPP
jgi:putative membrane protein insertion efficiency factor